MHFPCSVSPCIWGAGYLVLAPPLTIHKIMVSPNESGWDMALCVGDTGDSQKNLLSTGAEEVDLKEMLPVLKEQLTLC